MFYKVVVTHSGSTEPMVTNKELYDAANNFYMSECRNAAGYLTNKPGQSVIVELFTPEEKIISKLLIQSHPF